MLLHTAERWHNVLFRDHEIEGRKPPFDADRLTRMFPRLPQPSLVQRLMHEARLLLPPHKGEGSNR